LQSQTAQRCTTWLRAGRGLSQSSRCGRTWERGWPRHRTWQWGRSRDWTWERKRSREGPAIVASAAIVEPFRVAATETLSRNGHRPSAFDRLSTDRWNFLAAGPGTCLANSCYCGRRPRTADDGCQRQVGVNEPCLTKHLLVPLRAGTAGNVAAQEIEYDAIELARSFPVGGVANLAQREQFVLW